MKLRLTDGHLVTDTGIEDKDLLISGDKIEAIVDHISYILRPSPLSKSSVSTTASLC